MSITIEPIDGVAQRDPIPTDDPWAVDAAAYDWRIAGLHFNSAVSAENPYERAFSRVSKEAVDQSPQPGDQSLDGWWIRSQTDWSGGAGYEFMEPIGAEPIAKSFHWSFGVNPWEPGKIFLHREPGLTAEVDLSEDALPTTAVHADSAGTEHLYVSAGVNVYRFPVAALAIAGFEGDVEDPFCTLPSNVTGMVSAGGRLLASTAEDGVYEVLATPVQLLKSTLGIPIRVWWVKDRLIISAGRHLYAEPVPTSLVDVDTLTPLVSNADSAWKWSSVTSAPRGILISGRSRNSSTIDLITIGSDGGLPELEAPVVVAEFPSNEIVLEVTSFLSRFVVISTTAGVRAGVLSEDGSLTYGPLLRCPTLNGKFSTFDRFVWSSTTDAGEGRSGLIRFDLSEVTQETRVAWATDLRIPVEGEVIGQEVLAKDVVTLVAVSPDGSKALLYTATPGSLAEDYGVIQSGAIRLGAAVGKNWSRLNLAANPAMIGAIEARVVTNEVTAFVGTLINPQYEVEWRTADQALISQIAAVRLTLTKGELGLIEDPEAESPSTSDGSWNSTSGYQWSQTLGFRVRWNDLGGESLPSLPNATFNPLGAAIPAETPILESWSIRAIPAIERTELVRVPLLAFDDEVDTRGVPVGAEGSAYARYRELSRRVGLGRVVTLDNLNTGESDRVVVDDLSFRQTGKESRGSTFGGVIDVVARVL